MVPQCLQRALPFLDGDEDGGGVGAGKQHSFQEGEKQSRPLISSKKSLSSLPRVLLYRLEVDRWGRGSQEQGDHLATPLYTVLPWPVAFALGFSEKSEISGRSLGMVHFMCQTDVTTVPRYLARHQPGCHCEGNFRGD